MPCCARPFAQDLGQRSGGRRASTLLTTAPSDLDPVTGEEGVVEDDLIDRPADPGLADDDRAAPRASLATAALERPMTEPDTGMAGALDQEHLAADGHPLRTPSGCALRRSSTTWPLMNALVKPRGMWTGLMSASGSGRS